jgi:hypothetical protein
MDYEGFFKERLKALRAPRGYTGSSADLERALRGLNVHASPARPVSVSCGCPPLRRAGVRLYRLV